MLSEAEVEPHGLEQVGGWHRNERESMVFIFMYNKYIYLFILKSKLFAVKKIPKITFLKSRNTFMCLVRKKMPNGL